MKNFVGLQKRVTRILAVLIMFAMILPGGTVKAADNYGPAENFVLQGTDGVNTQLSSLQGKPTVLVFGRMGELLCGNTRNSLINLNALLDDSAYAGVQAFFLEIEKTNTVETVIENASGYTHVKSCVRTNSYSGQMWNYFEQCGLSGSVTLPLVITIDEEGNICAYGTGAQDTRELKSMLNPILGIEEELMVLPLQDTYKGKVWQGMASDEEWGVLLHTNKARMQNGLLPFSTFEKLQTAVSTRAYELTAFYSHTRPDGSRCFSVLDDLGLGYRAAAENIAYGYRGYGAVVNAWLNSSGHYNNIMNESLAHMGAGFDMDSNYSMSWAQLFLAQGCKFSDITLNNSSDIHISDINSTPNKSLDELGIGVQLTCSVHGDCYMPLIEEMCSGYDSEVTTSQVVTVKYGDLTTQFTIKGIDPVTLSYDANGGSGAPSAQTGLPGSALKLSDVIPVRSGYTFIGWNIAQGATESAYRAGDDYTLTEDVTLYAVWVEGENLVQYIFDDVEDGKWYVPFVQYVYDNNIMSGYNDTMFAPEQVITRAQFVTVLHNMENKPEMEYQSIFTDVLNGKWYTDPVLWAADKHITSGYDNGKFGIDDPITREQMAKMLYEYAIMKGYSTKIETGVLDSYPDKDKISTWATTSMSWAVSQGIMKGKGGGNLDPTGEASRAECATMIYNLLQAQEQRR